MRSAARAIAYILTAAVIAFTVFAGWIVSFGARTGPKPADCVIVLGCGLYGSAPSPFLMARLDEGMRLYLEGYAGTIIVSGGQGPGEDITEAEAMRRYLLLRGIPSADIIMEDRSTSTLTNLQFSRELMDEAGLSSAIIVSNWYHLARCQVYAGRLDIDASFSGVRLPQYRQVELRGFVREIPAIILAFLWRPGPLP